MEYSKLEHAGKNNVRLFIKHEEIKRVTDEEFKTFYQRLKERLGASCSVSIINANKGGNIIEFLRCTNPHNL